MHHPPAERGRVLERVDEPRLRAWVARLFELHDEATGFTDDLRVSTATALDTPLEGQIGPFRVVGELGRGGMGVVYEATQDLPKRSVALKTVHAQLIADAKERERFRIEVELMARVQHPGIPAVYQYLEVDGRPVLVMERVRGVRADTWSDGRSADTCARLLADICAAVGVAHEAGVVHQDLKPSNVLVTADGQPKVLDFGIACIGGSSGGLAGTPKYMAPEQLRQDPTDARTDVFALGVLGWRLCTGVLPRRTAASGDSITERQLPRALAAILERARAYDPNDRYPSARHLEADLRRYLAGDVVDALGRTPARCVGAWLRRHRRTLVGAAAVLLVGAASMLGVDRLLDRRERIAVERDAALALASAQAISEPVDTPAFARAFEELVADPRIAETRVPAQAWLWRSTREQTDPARRASVVRSLSAAVHPDDERRALEELARILADLRLFGPMGAILDRLPDDALPGLRASHRLRMDDTDLTDLGPAFEGPLRALATQAPFPVRGLAARIPGGPWLAIDDGVATVFGPSWEELHQLPLPPGRFDAMAEGDRFLLARSRREGGRPTTVLSLLDPTTGALQEVDRFPGRHGTSALDERDGQLRRLTWTVKPPTLRAGPVDGPSVVLRDAMAPPGARPAQRAVFADVNGDDATDLVTATGQWRGHGVRVFTGPDFELGGLLRLAARSVTVVDRGDRGAEIVAIGLPAGSRGQPLPGAPNRRFDVVRAALQDGRLDVRQRLQVSGLDRAARIVDLDGDGAEEVLFTGAGAAVGIYEGDALRFTRVPLPGHVVGAWDLDGRPGVELITDRRGETLAIGAEPGGPLQVPRPEAPAAWDVLPSEAPSRVTRAWEVARSLTEVGLVEDAIPVLEAIAEWGGPWGDLAGTQAIEIAERLPRRGRLGDTRQDRAAQLRIARLLLRTDAEHLTAEQRATLEAVGRTTGAPDVLAALGASPPLWADAAPVPAPPAATPWQVLRPESVAVGPRGVRLTDSRGAKDPLMRLPLQEVADLVAVEAALDLVELDFAGALGLRLAGDGWTLPLTLGRGGGGRLEDHHLALQCGGSPRVSTLVREAVRVRLVWDRTRRVVSCSLDEERFAEWVLPEDYAEPVAVELVTRGPRGRSPTLVDVMLRELRVLGATWAQGVISDADRAIAGDRAVLQEMASGQGLGAAWASAQLGEATATDLDGLHEDEVAFLLRTRPAVWNELVRAHLGERFGAVWARAWAPAVHFGTDGARRELVHPALAELPLDTELLRSTALRRARALAADGRGIEARAELLRLADAQSSQALIELAALDAAAGREDAARTWLDRAATLPHADRTAELLAGRPELDALTPELPFAMETITERGTGVHATASTRDGLTER